MSDYFDSSVNRVPAGSIARSSQVNAVRDEVGLGFDQLPKPTAIKQGIITYGLDSGTAGNYVITMPFPTTAYQEGMEVVFSPANSNTGVSTINVDGLGVIAIKRPDNTDLELGDIVVGNTVSLRYNGSSFRFTGGAPASSFASAGNSAAAASASETAAAGSAAAASASETAAATSESNAATSESNAAASAASITGAEANTAADRVQTGLDVISADASASTATTQASNASTSASNASTSASTANTQAGIATTQASNASTSASTATTQAGIATTQAGIATTQASNASTSASDAATSLSTLLSSMVGTVSQSGGIPTGAIIETGTNANGSYTKWADGTMICQDTSAILATTSTVEGGVYLSAQFTLLFPVAFVGLVPTVTVTAKVSSVYAWPSGVSNLLLTQLSMSLLGTRNTASGYLGYIAIGRWF